MDEDTIVALSSGALPSGIAVVRASGPGARSAAEAMAGALLAPRRPSLRLLRDEAGVLLDKAVVLLFDGPRTATGEDVAEFHLHGGRAVVSAVLEALTRRPGFRLAQAGEFTRRAFGNGVIDLTGAEGLADLLAAETEAQRRQAIAQAEGSLRRLYQDWRTRLIRMRAFLEASFDFSDEGDVGAGVADAVLPAVEALAAEMRRHLDGARGGEILREGFKVALLGAPNVGKSTLLNALAEREVAIVTELPGTTRDVLEVVLDLGGFPVRLFDTAGLRDTQDRVEILGIERALRAAMEADLVLALEDADHPLPEALPDEGPPPLRVWTKADLAPPPDHFPLAPDGLAISARTGAGLDALAEAIVAAAASLAAPAGSPVPARARHREAVNAATALLETIGPDLPEEIAAETLRLATDRLATLTGEVGVEDLLDVIFSEFCIGK